MLVKSNLSIQIRRVLGLFLALIVVSTAAWAQQQQNSQDSKKEGTVTAALPAESSSTPAKRAVKTATTPAPAPAKPEIGHAYRVGVEDDLFISVWREPELSIPVTVRPDGMITLPLVNDVKVDGLSTEELQNVLTDKLKAFVNEPQVTITVRAIRSRKVFLVGQVIRAGVYPINGQKTVLQLLAEAGGLATFAKSKGIYVLRQQGDKQIRIAYDYKRVIQANRQVPDLELFPGDMVVVP